MEGQAGMALTDFVLDEWRRNVPTPVLAAARAIAARYGDSVLGVLFYGSCLRTGEIDDRILDFYVIVDDYGHAYDKQWLVIANALLPPNVFYHELHVEDPEKPGGVTVRSKYAVLTLEAFERRVRPSCLNVSVWARFCQPCQLLLARDQDMRRRMAAAVGQAATTMLQSVIDLLPPFVTPRLLWETAFGRTYGAELRSERGNKGAEIFALDRKRYEDMTPLVLGALGQADILGAGSAVSSQPPRGPYYRASLLWVLRTLDGKIVSLLRLIKASMTFDGGIDYLAWKIHRHSGVEITITDAMRRRPVLSGLRMFLSLRKKGAFK